jgi:outer membrane protein assembly factor BamA
LANSSSKGIYWVSESATGNANFGLGFDSGSRQILQQNKSAGYEIRCVKL